MNALRLTSIMLGQAFLVSSLVKAAQDQFANATPFPYPEVTAFANVSNTAATAEPGEPSHQRRQNIGGPSKSVWWNFSTPTSGFVTLDVQGNFDTVLSVYIGTSLNRLVRVATDDDSQPGTRVIWGAKAGVFYRIALDSYTFGNIPPGSGTASIAVTRFTPFIPRTYYSSLISPTDTGFESFGHLTVATSATGGVSGTLRLGSRTHPFAGSMDAAGRISVWISRTTTLAPTSQTPAVLDLMLTGNGASLNGSLMVHTEDSNTDAAFPNLVLLPAAQFTALNPCPRAGYYVFTGPDNGDGVGFSIGSLTVSKTGLVVAKGTLGDGTPFSLTAPILDNGNPAQARFRARQLLFGNRGHVVVDMLFNAGVAPAALSGPFAASRPPKPGALFIPTGFYVDFNGADQITGNLFTPPAPNSRVSSAFDGTNGKGSFEGGNFIASIAQVFNLGTGNTFTYAAPNASKLSLTVNKNTGMLTGTAFIPAGKLCSIRGVVLNTPEFKGFRGFCTGATGNGRFEMLPLP